MGGNNHCVYPHRLVPIIFNSYLGLAIWPEIREGSVFPHLGQAPCQPMSQRNRHWHQLRGFNCSVAEHQALIPCSKLSPRISFRAAFQSLIYTLGNIWRLLVYGGDHAASLAIKAILGSSIANFTNGVPGYFGDIHICIAGNLPHHQHKSRGYCHLTGNPRLRIVLQDGIQNCI